MTADLRARIAEALREAGRLCDDDCADPAACDAEHPIQAAVLHFDVVTDVYGPVEELAKVAATVVQSELDRLRAACRSAAVLLRATADQPHPNSDALRAAARELDTIAQEAPRA